MKTNSTTSNKSFSERISELREMGRILADEINNDFETLLAGAKEVKSILPDYVAPWESDGTTRRNYCVRNGRDAITEVLSTHKGRGNSMTLKEVHAAIGRAIPAMAYSYAYLAQNIRYWRYTPDADGYYIRIDDTVCGHPRYYKSKTKE